MDPQDSPPEEHTWPLASVSTHTQQEGISSSRFIVQETESQGGRGLAPGLRYVGQAFCSTLAWGPWLQRHAYLGKCDVGPATGQLGLWAGPPLTQPLPLLGLGNSWGAGPPHATGPLSALALCQAGPPMPHLPDGTIKPSWNLGPESKQPLLGGLTQ